MNIGIVTTWFERGAAYVSRQIRDVLVQEHNVYIFARGGEETGRGNPVWDDGTVFWGRDVKGESTELDLKEFSRWVETQKIDIVIFNEQRWWDVVEFCNNRGLVSGAYIDYYTEDTIPLFDLYDFLICNTMRHLSVFDKHPQCFYIPWGTDIDLFTPQTEKAIKPDGITFFHSAGMAPDRKGTDAVIRAFKEIKNKKSYLFLHTQVELSEWFPALKDEIDGLEKEGRLMVYKGTVKAPGLYHKGDVYVYPAHLDGIGLTMAEALSCGMPLITVDNPPMNEFYHESCGSLTALSRIYSRADGYYWPKVDVDEEDLRNKMDHWAGLIDKIVTYKRNARAFAEEKLNWKKNAKELLSMITEVESRPTKDKEQARIILKSYNLKRMGRMKLFLSRHKFLQRFVRGILS